MNNFNVDLDIFTNLKKFFININKSNEALITN